MKHARKDLKVEGAVELPHVVAYLEQLVLALKAGTVRIRQEDEEVVLGPRGVIGFALSARDRGRRQSLALATDAKGEAHEGEPHSAEAEPDASDA